MSRAEYQKCFNCVNSCRQEALKIGIGDYCIRYSGNNPQIFIDKDKCNVCGSCINSCQIHNILNNKTFVEKSDVENEIHKKVQACTFCIVCKGKPACIEYFSFKNRDNFFHFFLSIINYPRLKLLFNL